MNKETETRKASTVKLQGGVEYAKVSTRLVEFHEDNAECSIETDVQFQTGENTWVVITAKVSCPRGQFVAHSMDTFKGKQKFLEKLETVAVGRALAFAGYMASGEIASFEEMDVFEASFEREKFRDAMLERIATAFNSSQDEEHLERLLKKVEQMTTLDESDRAAWTKKIIDKLDAIRGL